jgi:serine-type D-Ala-D-Ala carboxypeptidase/endopeptidase (penicillin-binding protein 4)
MICFLVIVPINNDGTSYANINAGTLQDKLTKVLEFDPHLSGAIAGISVRAATSGEILYEYNGNLRLKPASNLKLLTAAAALSVLGENYTFPTELHTDGQIVGNMLFGDLFLKGKGDPTLLKSNFEKLAEQLIQKGITEVHGDLIGDDTWYDDVRYSIDLPWSDEQTYYGAQVSALTSSPDKDYDAGTVIVKVQPAKKNGDKAIVTISPKTNYIKLVNKSTTVDSSGQKDIEIIRNHGTNIITIQGTIPVKSSEISEWISVWNPTGLTLELFKQSLAEKGIKINGSVRFGTTPPSTTLLTSRRSMPLSELLVPFMKLSNNVHAEILIKEMGKVVKGKGSWEKGLEVLDTKLNEFNINTKTLVIRDGSGVSHLNLVPTNEISKLLFSIQKETWFPVFLNSLPVGGEKEKMVGGTLRNRMKIQTIKGRIKAKTGSLTSVSSLSGYLVAQNGETLIFSIILNNLIDEKQGKVIEDKLVSILAN